MKLELPNHFRIHNAVHVIHTTPYKEQPADISQSVDPRPEPVPASEGYDHVVQAVLKYGKRGNGYQFWTKITVEPMY